MIIKMLIIGILWMPPEPVTDYPWPVVSDAQAEDGDE
jgi:hypothetical protein